MITAKSPCDAYLVKLLNNAISQDGYNDWYTEQMLFSFADGLLSNYMLQINGHCDTLYVREAQLISMHTE